MSHWQSNNLWSQHNQDTGAKLRRRLFELGGSCTSWLISTTFSLRVEAWPTFHVSLWKKAHKGSRLKIQLVKKWRKRREKEEGRWGGGGFCGKPPYCHIWELLYISIIRLRAKRSPSADRHYMLPLVPIPLRYERVCCSAEWKWASHAPWSPWPWLCRGPADARP